MTKTKTKSSKSKIDILWNDFRDNLSEGAKVFSQMSTEFLEEIKEKAEDLYEAGSEKFEQSAAVVHNYIDEYKGNKEISQLTREKEALNVILGDTVFHEFKKNGTVSKRFLTTKKMMNLFDQIELVDRQILKIGRNLDHNK